MRRGPAASLLAGSCARTMTVGDDAQSVDDVEPVILATLLRLGPLMLLEPDRLEAAMEALDLDAGVAHG